MTTTAVKICCIGNPGEARLAIEHGAAYVGLVSAMPSGPGVIPDATIAAIAATIAPPVRSVLLTSRTTTDSIIDQHRACGASMIQLTDRLTAGTLADLRAALPGVRLAQVVHVNGVEAIEEAVAAAEAGADYVLLDSGNPAAAVRTLGGTGRTHDWTVSRAIVEATDAPVFLAGGLNAENVAEAIDRVRPYGVDVCSGVRTEGRLDAGKLAAFLAAVRGAS